MAYIIHFMLLVLQVTSNFAIANGSAVSLSSFGSAPSGISTECKSEYDAIIPSCTTDDFQAGASCSQSCETALLRVQSEIDAACSGTRVDSTTLLGRIFQGEIIGALCPNPSSSPTTAEETTTASASATPSTTAVIPKSSSLQATSSAAPSSIIEGSSLLQATSSTLPTSIIVAPSVISTSTSASSAQTSGSSSSTTVTASSSDSIIEVATSSVVAVHSSTTSAAAQQSSAPKKLTMQEQQIAALANSGGGSPFDIISFNTASRPVGNMATAAIAIACAILLLGS